MTCPRLFLTIPSLLNSSAHSNQRIQAMTIPTHPIVIFSSSSTGHWASNKCTSPYHLTPTDSTLLTASLSALVTEHSREQFHHYWKELATKDHHYPSVAMQVFTHHGQEDYACQGPYIAKWMDGAASWHPSVIAHHLRANHHVYFWLQIWQLALQELRDLVATTSLPAIAVDVEHKLDAFYAPSLPPALFKRSPFIDNMTCFTDYEPRTQRESSLKAHVRSGLVTKGDGWKFGIYEDLVDINLVKRSKAHGYLDYKWMLFTKDSTKPLSLDLEMASVGPVFLCETPGIWGKLPTGFAHLSDGKAEYFVTLNVPSNVTFVLNATNSVKMKVIKHDICVQLLFVNGGKNLPKGKHVITVQPLEKVGLIIAWLLTP